MRVAEKFLNEQPRGDTHAAEDSHHSHGPEEVERTAQVLQKEADGNKIKEDPESSGDAVVRYPAFTIDIANGHLTNRCAMP